MENNEQTIFTLREFIDIFGGIDQINAIYIDSEDDKIRDQLQNNPRPLDTLHKYNNIMIDDEYLVLSNGDYVLNKDKIFEDYGDYIVSMYFPVIPPEYVQSANEIMKMTDIDYLSHIAEYSNGCELLIKKSLEYNITHRFAYKPNVSSGIYGWAIMNYCEPSEELYKPLEGLIPPFYTDLVAIVSTKEEMYKVLSERRNYESMVFQIDNGNISDSFQLFTTDKDGLVKQMFSSEEDAKNAKSGS